ncbi:glycoside hydrolase family 3 N-terminal domain-containing protein [Methylocystis heyeri]|uniref:beta-glucosidase n=1 Tax=Methylocystis heyeri TaxID=391905 RepID=A0A6B8KIH4_9HYPH|nr:glycoside hydrolase family 3 N-terminal domain-containing protein [Methylocystis heyeri]QGM47477.1 beta-glucosidase [Methylocystis heyeri]
MTTTIERLLSEMTLDEKIGQLNLVTAGQAVTGPIGNGDISENIRAGFVGGVLNIWGRDEIRAAQRLATEETRLGIPLFFGLDVLHGYKTIFPIPLAEAGLFDPLAWERSARVAAAEAAADGLDLTFAPMLDVARDPRWGRIAEGPGEDPLVASVFAKAKVRGFQGARLSGRSAVAATAKHFCAGGAALGGREYAPVDISERTLEEVYLPPFLAAVEAGCAAIMPAFNSLNGVPMSMHRDLLTGRLREEHGFSGLFISDYTAIAELVEHGVAASLVEAAALALRAGVDVDMVSGVYVGGLKQALERGLVDLGDIDGAVRRVLKLKNDLGLFDDPYRRLGATEIAQHETNALALDIARRAVTLLTNKGVLPLSPKLRRLAVIGPLADARGEMLGPWSAAGAPENCVTILEGLRNALPDAEISFHPGCGINDDDRSGFEQAKAICAASEAVVLCLGEAAGMSGEAASRARLTLPGVQRQLAEEALSTGVPTVAVLCSGRPLIIGELAEKAGATLAAWFLGSQAGAAVAQVLTGRFNPTGRLALAWPRETGQIPVFHAQRSSGRPFNATNPFTSKYIDLSPEPLFAFGHGLSYSQARLGNLRVSPSAFSFAEAGEIMVEAEAVNEAGALVEETVFLFIHDIAASVAQPQMALKAWAKVSLAPGETKTVKFNLARESFTLLDRDLKPRFEAGEFEILVGLSADRSALLSIRTRAFE